MVLAGSPRAQHCVPGCLGSAAAAPVWSTPGPDPGGEVRAVPLGAGLGAPRPTGVEMISDVDVVIAGAGPTGLMLAGDLARAGVNCEVLERRPGRSGLTRAMAVHTRTLEQLDARGIADQLIASGTSVPELEMFAGARLELARLPTRFPYMLVAPQYETERVLEERARHLGAKIRYGAEVIGLAQYPDGVEVTVKQDGHESRVRGSYVVGADGIHSTVRQALGIPFPGKPVVESMMLADVLVTQPPPQTLTVSATGDAFGLIVPFG